MWFEVVCVPLSSHELEGRRGKGTALSKLEQYPKELVLEVWSRPKAAAETLLEIKPLRLHPRPNESNPQEVEPTNLF